MSKNSFIVYILKLINIINSESALKMWKKLRVIIINHLGFSQSEANGFIVLVLIILLTAILPRLYFRYYTGEERFTKTNQESLKKWGQEITASLEKRKVEKFKKLAIKPKKQHIESFNFDPNTATESELIRLGFRDQIAKRIVNFRNAGGVFRVKADLGKIYGIDAGRLEELQTLIQLPNVINLYVDESEPEEKKSTPVVRKNDINHCSKEDLMKVPGIGKAFSERIIKYRDLLGGYISLNQLGEVYNFPDSLQPAVSRYFYADKNSVKKINLNADEVARHPYIDYNQLNAIKNYRKVHGDFQAVEEIKKIKLVDDSLFQKLLPYLSI